MEVKGKRKTKKTAHSEPRDDFQKPAWLRFTLFFLHPSGRRWWSSMRGRILERETQWAAQCALRARILENSHEDDKKTKRRRYSNSSSRRSPWRRRRNDELHTPTYSVLNDSKKTKQPHRIVSSWQVVELSIQETVRQIYVYFESVDQATS